MDNAKFILSDQFLSIDNPFFYGRYIQSLNSKYIVGYNQGNGLENFEDGGIVFIDEGVIKFRIKMKRPLSVDVSDVGSFVVCANPNPDKNISFISVYSSNRETLFEKKYSKGVLTCNISNDGKYLVTLSNPQSGYGYKIEFIDLGEKQILWSIKSHTGYSSFFNIQTDHKMVLAIYRKYDGPSSFIDYSYRYNFNGEFVDSEKFFLESIDHFGTSDFYNEIKKRLRKSKVSSEGDKKLLIDYVQKAIDTINKSNVKNYSSLTRVLGEVYEIGRAHV